VLLVAVIAASALGFSSATTAASYHYDRGGTPAASNKDAAAARVAELGRPLDEAARDLRVWSYDDRSERLRAVARRGGRGSAPNTATRYVIGGMEDLGPGSLRAGEATVASRLPSNAGNRLGNWLNNRDVLRSIMREGQPIRDASVDSAGNLLYQDTRRFVTLERDFLRSSGWAYDPSTQFWMPAG